MLTSHPLITICITCYNAEDTIERAIRSAREQDWLNFEILVVDDCSTDGSLGVLNPLVKAEEPIRVLRHELNLGVGAARNTLLREAKGEFIAFFDDDDESLPWRLTRQFLRITDYERNTGAKRIACFTARTQILPNGLTRYEPAIGMDMTPAPSGQAVADLILLGRPLKGRGGSGAACSLMARRGVFERLGGFNASLRREEDTDFNLRLALQGGHFAGLSSPLVRQTLTVTSDKAVEEQRKNSISRMSTHRVYLERTGWFDFSIRWANAKFDLQEGKLGPFLKGSLKLVYAYPYKFFQRVWWLFLLYWRSLFVERPITNEGPPNEG